MCAYGREQVQHTTARAERGRSPALRRATANNPNWQVITGWLLTFAFAIALIFGRTYTPMADRLLLHERQL